MTSQALYDTVLSSFKEPACSVDIVGLCRAITNAFLEGNAETHVLENILHLSNGLLHYERPIDDWGVEIDELDETTREKIREELRAIL